jgi:hypothetical protein
MALDIARSRLGLQNQYDGLSQEVKTFFADIPALLDSDFSLDIVLGYVFFRLEQGQRRVLYCGARKLHKTNSELTWKALNLLDKTRGNYHEFFKRIYGFPVGAATLECLTKAEEIRDRLMHGKELTEPEKREAISLAMQYVEQTNDLIHQQLGFKPYAGDLRGIVGRAESLEKATSRWVLTGMGFFHGKDSKSQCQCPILAHAGKDGAQIAALIKGIEHGTKTK